MKGTVKFFNTEKGFGFISGEDAKDYFAHSSAIPAGTTLKEGDAVTFEATAGDRGPKATHIVVGAAPHHAVPHAHAKEEPKHHAKETSEEETPADDESAEDEPADESADDEDEK